MIHRDAPHDSALAHVTGQADYTDDRAERADLLHMALGLSDCAHGRITRLDLGAVRTAPGVVAVLTADDLPHNDVSPNGLGDDPILAPGMVSFHGQPVFAVVAQTRLQARAAVRLAAVDYAPLPAVLDAMDAHETVVPGMVLRRGDPGPAFAAAPHRLQGRMRIGGQDHFYLEGQIALAEPDDDGGMLIHVSTQHPSEVQHMVAHALDLPSSAVTVRVRRMGGGFGGKETQMNLFACLAAMAARRLGRTVKLRPDRDEDMLTTGKRHDFIVDYSVGFDDQGRILAVDGDWFARCGFSADLSGAVTDRALFHGDNAYFYPDVTLRSHPMRTNTVSNTAFRGFGGPQGVIVAERIVDDIATVLGFDPLTVRRRNLYRNGDLTPYHQPVEDQILPRLLDELESSSDYQARRTAVAEWNARGGTIRRGIALTPVKFGISFTATHFNQAGALVHIYADGSIRLNHGGTEMGQGLHTKVAQVVADVFQVGLNRVRITATSTDQVPNTSATAASSGTDLNGMAAQDAAQQIKTRLVDFLCETKGLNPDQISFQDETVQAGDETISFPDLIRMAYLARVHLSAAGFYKTPDIHWNRAEGRGHPFYYFAYGAAVSEVSVDSLTGEYRVERVDILHDVGRSLNPALDRGQVEGAFVQGMGWLTTEELWWDDQGRLRTHAPSTYKIPVASDRPRDFRLALADWSQAEKPTIRRSKAVGEPPFMLAISVFQAIQAAVASFGDPRQPVGLDAPATPERVLMAIAARR
ncbi:MAG: xanthine dehydrogenase molybdopterin binding subunit [Paracoccus sp. (in: a-proteobacteria)]|uniref:xanthine dehydrogenase molybdopterin binding subunit n=1 Tax=Paracoccus sp. TaxID=267 RepID=UPI0026DFCF7E|nr:xanthine dehydrogenase molybdopterin binding subunit [Paracoccus sp. (in: a-proteobacteria)]MDO5620245.1 xanthine dehydrogenase molybdopterin binding subunit [Paracoccus sp. (in: a-proteobacteria)]